MKINLLKTGVVFLGIVGAFLLFVFPARISEASTAKDSTCPFPQQSVSFNKLDLGELPGEPKIWANGRILISLGHGDWLFQWNGKPVSEKASQKSEITSGELKKLLFEEEVAEYLEEFQFEEKSPQKVEFSGVAFPKRGLKQNKKFEHAVELHLQQEDSEKTSLPDNLLCGIYFTVIGCPHCAKVDPLILNNLPQKYPKLVIIEYVWSGLEWKTSDNAKLLSDFAGEYKIKQSVPQLAISNSDVRAGEEEISNFESYVKDAFSQQVDDNTNSQEKDSGGLLGLFILSALFAGVILYFFKKG